MVAYSFGFAVKSVFDPIDFRPLCLVEHITPHLVCDILCNGYFVHTGFSGALSGSNYLQAALHNLCQDLVDGAWVGVVAGGELTDLVRD